MTCCLVPRYEPAHYVLKTLAYTMINLRHYGLHCFAPDTCACTLRRIAPRLRSFAPCRSPGATTHIFASRLVVATHPVS
jgi:hypothetical protein